MTFSEFPILADENIHEEVLLFLRQTGFNVAPVSGTKLAGLSDLVLLDYAFKEKRIIVTQDSDFARFIFTLNISFVGIVHFHLSHHHYVTKQKTDSFQMDCWKPLSFRCLTSRMIWLL